MIKYYVRIVGDVTEASGLFDACHVDQSLPSAIPQGAGSPAPPVGQCVASVPFKFTLLKIRVGRGFLRFNLELDFAGLLTIYAVG